MIFLLIAVASSAFHTAPESTKALITSYQQIVPTQENGPWLDVYIFDYFYMDNQFNHVTPATIREHAHWFYVPARYIHHWSIVKGKRVEHTTYIPPTHLSIIQALNKYGLSQYDAMALELEGLLAGQYHVGDSGKGSYAPVPEAELRYQAVNLSGLYSFLHNGGSAFTYADVQIIANAAKSDDINPLLLVAITGQEESFVPTSWQDWPKIINNPFNVNVSWQDYNTNLTDAAQIAANTVAAKLQTPPPPGMDPIAWMNSPANPDGIYAQDPNWPNGVRAIFTELQSQFSG